MRSYGNTNAAPYAAAPTVGAAGDTYWDTVGKALYVSDGTTWVKAGPSAGGAATTISSTAPGSPVQGQMWWRNDPDGNLYISYNDGNSTQWVPAVPGPPSTWKVVGSTLQQADVSKTLVTGTGSALRAVAFDTKFSAAPYPISFALTVPFKADVFSILNCSCYTSTSGAGMGIIASLDGVDMTNRAIMYFNEINSHKFVAAHNVNRGVAAGSRTIGLRVAAPTTSDGSDYAHMTFQMVEVP